MKEMEDAKAMLENEKKEQLEEEERIQQKQFKAKTRQEPFTGRR